MTHINGTSVPAVLEVSRKVYATSLVLYPNEFRSEFGAEMVLVFDEQVSDAYSRSGFPGLLRVCFSAAWEFVTIAFPGRLAGRMLPLVGVTATLALMMWFTGWILYVMETACSGCGH